MKTLITASILALCATGANATISLGSIKSVTQTFEHCVVDTANYDQATGKITGTVYVGDNWDQMYFTTSDAYHNSFVTDFTVKEVYVEANKNYFRTAKGGSTAGIHAVYKQPGVPMVDYQGTGTPWNFSIDATLDANGVYGFYVQRGTKKKWCGDILPPPPVCTIDQAIDMTLTGQLTDQHNFALKQTIPLKLNITGYDNSTVSATGQTLPDYDTLNVSAWLTGNEVPVVNGTNSVEINMTANSHNSSTNLLSQTSHAQSLNIMQATLTLECK